MIKTYSKLNDLTIILIDANDGLYTRRSLLPTFLHNTKLVPLISNPELYPPTHAQGSYCIDFIFGSPSLIHMVEATGITSFLNLRGPIQTIEKYLLILTQLSYLVLPCKQFGKLYQGRLEVNQ
jgi:hypothetical protein